MMARLLADSSSPAAPAASPGPMCESSKPIHVPARKLSFKTKQSSTRGNYRATKVSLSSNHVALIASKFNTIVIDDGVQGRALLRKLSNNQRKPLVSKELKARPVKLRGEGVVKAAIEIFEPHDSDKIKISKSHIKKGTDSRAKIVVVRKSSSKSSVKLDDFPNAEAQKNVGCLYKEKTKESISTGTNGAEIMKPENNVDIKEVKRKPSLKAKPILRQNVTLKKETGNSLNQRIAKFNNANPTTISTNKSVLNQDIRTPNFNLNERIAQFNRNETGNEMKNVDHQKINMNSEEKENKQEMTKSILKNTNKRYSLIEQTKDQLATRVQQNNNINQHNRPFSLINVKKQSLIKDKFTVGEKKELTVFECTEDDDKLIATKEDEINNRLSVLKDMSVLGSTLTENQTNSFENKTEGNLKVSENFSFLSENYLKKIPDQLNIPKSEKEQCPSKDVVDNKSLKSPTKDCNTSLKTSVKTIVSESPKLEKKNLCVAFSPSEDLQLDKIEPNHSFLWKPTGKTNVVKEVPIYDDRPQSLVKESCLLITDCEINASKTKEKKNETGDESKSASSLDLDVASSFILEMTEHIERRFSCSSTQESESEEKCYRTTVEEPKQSIPKNPSFLHGKNHNVVLESKADTQPETVKTGKLPLTVSTKPSRGDACDLPPQLPEKRPSATVGFNDNLNPNPPPIPPSHTKPKVVRTPSQEAWIENCKKILELPPPRKCNGDKSSVFELPPRKPLIMDQQRSLSDNKFSVSQVDLLRRMSEMNIINKRSSLPSGAVSGLFNESDHEYTSIQQFEMAQADDQDTYEAIGENNYAEIEESEVDDRFGEEEGANNIYDDVIGQDDHYEAINCNVGQADSDSSCDQSNSLYGLTRPTSLATRGVYQVSGGSSEASDEWIDMDNSDDQHESIYIFREKDQRGADSELSWSMKVRRQRSRLEADDGSDESTPRSYENIEANDDTPYCDDFDDSFSDSSFDQEPNNTLQQVVEEKRQAPITEGIYGLMKQAGQHMRKHWALGKSLTRMRKNKSTPNVQSFSNLGERGWSFKSKHKPSSTQSTFYLNSTNTLTRSAPPQPEPKVDPRRLSTTSMISRPTSPPPPPPPPRNSLDDSSRRKSELNNSNCSSGDNEGYIEGQRRLSRNGNSMWYIDTSTDSASEHGSSQGSDLNLRFADEPLYQFYAENIAKQLTLSSMSDRDSEGYEEITPCQSPLPSALDLVSTTHHRSLWCELSQVKNSGVLDTLSQSRKRLQEAKFEVMTSEASYFKSLTVLDKLFASCPLFSDENILSRDDRRTLFGNVSSVRKCSEKLLAALQLCWQDCILLTGICEVVHDHVRSHRQVYVKYCTNQISIDRTLKSLKQANSNFSTVLTQLEMDPECQSLTLYSFLMLPMQRITRLRLLFETMLSLLDSSDSEFTVCQGTLDVLNRCVTECNEGARSQERHEEMVRLSKQLDFPSEVRIPILEGGSNRWLVRSGQLTQVNMDAKQTFGRRLSRSGPKFTLFLFTDLLLLTKKKSEESFLVVDHCPRNLVECTEIKDFPGNNRYLLQLTLLENSDNKSVEMTLSCEGETDRQRWLQVLSPPQSDEPGETLYEGWDCPQVTAIHMYTPTQPDELTLSLGDIVNVLRKSEGWFYGERTRDGEKGWFPGNHTREIASKHVRARNLKQRHRLLQLSADFVQQQRKSKS